MTAPSDPTFRHVYHLSPARLLVVPIMWLIVAGYCIWLAWSTHGDPAAGADQTPLILIGVFTAFALPFFGLMWQSRLVLTPQGIAHYQFGYTIRSTWANLVVVDLTPGAQHLVLAERGTRSRLLAGSVKVLDATYQGAVDSFSGDSKKLASGRLITLSPFMAHWTRGPLREDLLRLAPHLFQSNGQPRIQ